MKYLVFLALILLSLSTVVLAQNQPGGGQGGRMGMDDQQRMQMREHMQEMRETMKRIRQTDDPEERQALMREHRRSMQEGMSMMDGSMMGRAQGGRSMSTEERMQMMQDRIDMMQMMMQQMLEREELEARQ